MQNQPNLDLAFHALADNTRRQILERLSAKKELSAGELGACFNFAQPTISKHLSVLEKSGLVSRTIEGRKHMFSINTRNLTLVETWFERHRTIWENSLDNLVVLLSNPKPE